jgi:hypothetical protein
MNKTKKPTILNQNFYDVEPKYEINLAAAYLEPDLFSWSSHRFCWIKHPLGKWKGSSAETCLLRDMFFKLTIFAQ